MRPQGLISVDEDVLWADDPERAVTVILTRTLTDILDVDADPRPGPLWGCPMSLSMCGLNGCWGAPMACSI